MPPPPPANSAHDFVARWSSRGLSERKASQPHFIDLCALLDVPHPTQHRSADPDYCFDAITTTAGSRVYAANKGKGRPNAANRADADGPALFAAPSPAPSGRGAEPPPGGEGGEGGLAPLPIHIIQAPPGQRGYADVWKRNHFCWEYKRQDHADLDAALFQARSYLPSLDNPPLVVACDISTFIIETHFNGYPTTRHAFSLEELAEPSPDWFSRDFGGRGGVTPLALLRYAFTDPERFRPTKTVMAITEELTKEIGKITSSYRERKHPDGSRYSDHDLAHFLMQIVFAMFAEDVGLLPKDILTGIIQNNRNDPGRFTRQARTLFAAMAAGGDFGPDSVKHFNGGLFKGIDKQPFPQLTSGEIGHLSIVAARDWSAVEPSILGTLFERALIPTKRAQIGAHYTGMDDILLVIEPVVMAPLRREWAAAQRAAAASAAQGTHGAAPAHAVLKKFHDRLAGVTVLDPACGSGNFLYAAIQQLLTLEKEVIDFARQPEFDLHLPSRVAPTQLHGIEINEYAAELARISIWIGYLKWQRDKGIPSDRRPILDTLDTIECRDAILDLSNPETPVAARWPEAEFIVGNPPFLGTKMLRGALGDNYVDHLFNVYEDRIPGFSDLCCYWFELARTAIERRPRTRAGLLATQAIRNGEARRVLERIKETGDIYFAWPDRKWTLEGAAVQVSIIGFGSDCEPGRILEGKSVTNIHSDLTSGTDLTDRKSLAENQGIGYVADVKSGKFDIEWEQAAKWLSLPNPNHCSNLDVLIPWFNGLDVLRRNRGYWIVDFGYNRSLEGSSEYESPFEYTYRVVRPERAKVKRKKYREKWWIHAEPCEKMRRATRPLDRYIGTPVLAKHRIFSWVFGYTLADHQLTVFARPDDYFFGVLHSAIHELWARRMGTQLREAESGFRYTPTTCFETFPLPWPPGSEPVKPKANHHALHAEIAAAAAALNTLREAWLNPPGWLAEVEKKVDITYRSQLAAVPNDARPLLRRSAVMAEAAKDPKLKKRTLTNLYNERPAWLRLAHARLDRSVLAAYRAFDPEGGWDESWADAYEPFGAGEIAPPSTPKPRRRAKPDPTAAARAAAAAARAPIDERILSNLLRLNTRRSVT